jgi:hypothetical protein
MFAKKKLMLPYRCACQEAASDGQDGQEMTQRYVIIKIKHSTSLIAWDCFTGTGARGSLYFLLSKTTMNGQRFIEMLKDKLVFWIRHH